MLTKTYTCNVIDSKGDIVGSGAVNVWFVTSPYAAYELILNLLPYDRTPIDFRRVK